MVVKVHEGDHLKIKPDGSGSARWKRCLNMACVAREGKRCCRCRGLTKGHRCNQCRKNPCPSEIP